MLLTPFKYSPVAPGSLNCFSLSMTPTRMVPCCLHKLYLYLKVGVIPQEGLAGLVPSFGMTMTWMKILFYIVKLGSQYLRPPLRREKSYQCELPPDAPCDSLTILAPHRELCKVSCMFWTKSPNKKPLNIIFAGQVNMKKGVETLRECSRKESLSCA